MNVDLSVTGFSLSAWLDDHDINPGQQLQSYIVDLLLEELDVAGYLINPQCQMSSYQPYTEGCKCVIVVRIM